jgi:5-methylcytosine-specific restriction endonuclease McrA
MTAATSRAEAKALGMPRYATGRPCKYGHIAEKFTATGNCVVCGAERRAAYERSDAGKAKKAEWYLKNSDKAKERNAAWRGANPERDRQHKAKWRAANPGHPAAHYAANAEKIKASTAAWAKSNPEKASAFVRNRKARIRAAEGSHTGQDVKNIHDAQKGKCAYCGKKLNGKYHADHIVPIKRGGCNWPSNLQILCPSCNSRKSAKDPIEFAQELGLLL